MGTIVNLTVVHPNVDEARTAVHSCLGCMENLEALLSRYQPQSQLSQLNRLGRLINPDQHLVDLIKQSLSISEISKGAFDITESVRKL
jgi:FAD:protein FMN transferase